METQELFKFSFDESQLLQKADIFFEQAFKQKKDTRLIFHNYAMFLEAITQAKELCVLENTNDKDTETAILAVGFLLVGYLLDYNQPILVGKKQAQQFLQTQNVANEDIGLIFKSMDAAAGKKQVVSIADQITSDTITITTYIKNYTERHPLLKLEREFLLNQQLERTDWAQLQLQELLQQKLYTVPARREYESVLAQNILMHKQRIEKEIRNLEKAGKLAKSKPKPFQNIEEDMPLRTMQTFFRANYRNHINLSAIADNKANIMISVNSILISVLITFLSYRNIAATNPMVLLPVVIFLVTGLASLIFAVLSARPKVTSLNAGKKDKAEIEKNIVFFGNFVTLKLEEFEETMDKVFRDGELLLGNMTRDLYFLGKVLDKKYRYLTISYNIFMVGFVATVLSFLIVLFK